MGRIRSPMSPRVKSSPALRSQDFNRRRLLFSSINDPGGWSFKCSLGGSRKPAPSAPPPAAAPAPPSQNVINLQRRTAGVLPIRVDVPRAGTSHQFVKPLVVDQETVVKLRYKQRS